MKRLAIAAIAFGTLLVLALVVGLGILAWTNRILSAGTLRQWVNGNPETLFLDYGSASSSWPGRVRVRNLRLRARDPNVEWEVRIDDCNVTVSLPDLLRKKFHATSVEAAGLTFRLRQRLNDGAADATRARYLPPIEGFPAVPLRGHPRILPGNPDDLWAIQLARLTASPVREIWIDTYRYTGNAVLIGGFDLVPKREAEVGPATLSWKSGTLAFFGIPAISPVRARVECRIARFKTQAVNGPQVWDWITARADWNGALAGLEFLNPILGSEPRISGGTGEISGAISLDRGKGSVRTALSAKGASARYAAETFRGAIAADLRLNSWRPALGAADISGSSLKFQDVASTSGDGRTWWGRFGFESGRIRLVRLGQGLDGHIAIRCRDARPLYTFFGVGLPRWTQALLTLENFSAGADIDFEPRVLRVENLDARGGDFRVLGRYSRIGGAKEGVFLIERPPFRIGVEIEPDSTRLKLIGAAKWFKERYIPSRRIVF